jgi:PAS domain S-box-containing protein
MNERHTHASVDVFVDRQLQNIHHWFAAIVDSSNDPIISKNLNGVISTWNAAAERLFGYSAEEAVGQPITIIIPAELYDEEREILRRLRAGERIESHETVRITRDGRRLDVSLTISPVRGAGGAIIGASKIVRDVTESKRAQAALRASERRLAAEIAGARTLQSISTRLISESTQESVFAQILDAAIELMAADAGSLQMLASDAVSLTLLDCRQFHHESAAFWRRVTADASSTCGRALRSGERVLVSDVEHCRFLAGTQDLDAYRRSGIRAVQSTPLRSRSGRPLGMLSTHWRRPHTPTEDDFRLFDVLARQAADLIERALTEEALSTVSQRLIEAQEEERAHFARELHDDVNQRLALVAARLGRFTTRRRITKLTRDVVDAQREVIGLLKDVQALSHRLHPPQLEYVGLATASAAMCRDISSQHRVDVIFHAESVPNELPMRTATCVYRVLQEALQNAVKHSGAAKIDVSLRGATDCVELTVDDCGHGFDLNSTEARGLGLVSMKERLRAVEGQLDIRSEPGRGTAIRARVPCSDDEDNVGHASPGFTMATPCAPHDAVRSDV